MNQQAVTEKKSIAVIGASLAGFRAVETLRREGFGGTIHFVGDETHRPYDRPPLSKQVLAGEWETDRVWLGSDEHFEELDLTLHLGDRAISLDAANRVVTLESGASLDVDGIIIATGARPRTLGTTLPGVVTLRSLEDAQAIRTAMADSPTRVVVIGAGFIGAEVAATARGLGHEVVMVEMADTPFERSLGSEVGHLLADIHRDHGVDVRLGVGSRAIVGTDQVTAVELTDGTVIEADLVVVGIGVEPNVEWLSGSGLTLGNGVTCDETSLAAPGIVAAGDVAEWPNPIFGDMMRVEHWDNAITHGVHAAKRLLHGEGVGPYAPVPWFWSDQYDRKIQLAGRTQGFDRFEIVHGNVESRRFVALYGRGDRLVAVFGMNRPRHVMGYRSLIESQTSWSEALATEI